MDPKICNKAADFVSFISFILCCIFHSWIITFQKLHSYLRHAFRLSSYLLPEYFRKQCDRPDMATFEPCRDDHSIMSREDVEIVMEKLGLIEPLLIQDSFDIANILDGREPSLDEVREVFALFDENNDGFIDAEELKRVVSSIGLSGFSVQECKRMIMAYDDNGDGKIDFGEFVKLMLDCSC